jgi:hypothetical protein
MTAEWRVVLAGLRPDNRQEASAIPVAEKAAAARTPTWLVPAPPESAGTNNQGFSAVP